ncbi:glutamine amidotransferase-like class 1 domain-containing protein 1 [Portunus trituberculatus]|uniref:glutamine amidotransferase-like class 1 domain-containing protein 1 n=1 Tax=Portunus trituberculatus TaxID=210409 RepID=UPI001E1CFE4A|nr:glutamine amidotransferase-like class 1 domain-containing protein 1 [Portunus trituberculatus]XP_045127509.1 glutamine amidotransferase-like class 1 domain-containing protein 1 [Portunus trituberculatus]
MAKQSCLIVLSASPLGVSAPSFLQCYKLTQSAFNIEIATPEAAAPVFIDKDDQSSRWLNDIGAKNLLEPRSLSEVQGGQYSCVVVPHSPGASEDLASCKVLGKILTHCLAERKPVCAIGLGVCALLSAVKGEPPQWAFRDIALTGSSLAEVTTASYFSSLPLIPGDAILDRAGIFSTGAPASIHIVVNAGVVTGQNPQSTLSAVQNMILLANQRQSKGK